MLGVLVGLGAGGVAAAIGGARRTTSAYDQLVEDTNAADLALAPACADGETEAACARSVGQRSKQLAHELRGSRAVRDVAIVGTASFPITDADGEILQPEPDGCFSGSGATTVEVARDGRWGSTVNGNRIVVGRAPRRSRPREALLSAQTAQAHGIDVGDRVKLYANARDCIEPSDWGTPIELTIVGLTVQAGHIRPTSGFYLQSLQISPDLAISSPHDVEVNPLEGGATMIAVTLADAANAADVHELDLPPFQVVVQFADNEADIERGLHRDADALGFVGLVASLAALCVIAPALLRFETILAVEDETLRALGWTRRERFVRALVHGCLIGCLGALASVLVVVGSSRWTPIGIGRRVEPRNRFAFDLAAIGIGVASAIVIAIVGVVLGAWLGATARQRRATPRRSVIGAGLTPLRAKPVIAVGVRFGLESPRRGAAHGTQIVAMALGVAIVAGTLVYTRSAQHLRESPRLAGWSWDEFVILESRELAALPQTAATWPEVERTGGVSIFIPYQMLLGEDEIESAVVAFTNEPAMIRPTAIRGRAPESPSEILLNPLLARRLDADVGSHIEVSLGEADAVFEVVGLGPVPVIAARFDSGSAVTFEALQSLLGDEAPSAPDVVLLDRRDDADAAALRERLAAAGVVGGDSSISEKVLDAVGVDTTRAESTPDLLALLMLVMTTVLLAYVLATAMRLRRDDLAVLRTLGFTRMATRATFALGATSVIAIVMLLGIPAGILVGKAAWRAYARELGVLDEPFTAPLEFATLAVGGCMAALVIAMAVTRVVLRQTISDTLRAE